MRLLRVLAGTTAALAVVAVAQSAFANCRIHNDTNYSFTVESGNTSNQSVGAHTETSIAAGKIIGRSKEGKTVSGFCKDGDHVEIKDDHGVPILVAK
jgi:hypothetical protein